MIRTNLATRPAGARYWSNWTTVAVALLIVATLLNVGAIFHYTRSDTALKAQAARDENRALELNRSTAKLRQSANAAESTRNDLVTGQARGLIARRLFSWTELFNRFESTLPPGARITAVRPGIRGGDRIVLEVTVLARSLDDVDRFLSGLEGTDGFADVVAREERRNEMGQIEALIETAYTPLAERPDGSLVSTAP